jgi:hypothetical protein
MNGKILDLGGNALAPAPTETKKAHDAAEHNREQQRLNGLLNQWVGEFVRDMNTPDGLAPVVQPDRDAVFALYDGKWREQAALMNRSGFPHVVDEEAFAKVVDQMEAKFKHDAACATPLHKLENLAKYELYTWKSENGCTLLLNSHVGVMVYSTGRVQVWVRPSTDTIEDWADTWVRWAANEGLYPALVDADNYTLGELLDLYRVLRLQSVAEIPWHLLEERGSDDLKPLKPENASWLKRAFK